MVVLYIFTTLNWRSRVLQIAQDILFSLSICFSFLCCLLFLLFASILIWSFLGFPLSSNLFLWLLFYLI